MCLHTSNVDGTGKWNWAGDDVVWNCIVKSHRSIAGTHSKYELDIRSFLANADDAVLRRAVDEAVRGIEGSDEREQFWSCAEGAFDLRAVTLAGYVSSHIKYQARATQGEEPWQFPDETLARKCGDCEDLAFLLASLLLAAKVSGYMVRVALGQLVIRDATDARLRKDHVWVMYKNEQGHWIVLDPSLYFKESSGEEVARGRPSDSAERYEYVPHFVFNAEHLWAIRRKDIGATWGDYWGARSLSREDFDPSFGVSVHNHIFDEALAGMSWFKRQYVKACSLAVDANLATYDPRDHFDNGYIEESFDLIERRLKTRNLGDFALVAHAIGDFYAHSTYEVFGAVSGGKLVVFDRHAPKFDVPPDYGDAGRCPLADTRFTVNEPTGTVSRSQMAKAWNGKVISGRYAQIGDPHQGAAERLTYIPRFLRDGPKYQVRRRLPHHNEIAVDAPTKEPGHKLYSDPGRHALAFKRRQNAAIEHLRQIYLGWR